MANWNAFHAAVVLLVAGLGLLGVSNVILSQKLEDEMAKNRECSIMQLPPQYVVCIVVGALTLGIVAAKAFLVAAKAVPVAAKAVLVAVQGIIFLAYMWCVGYRRHEK